MAARRGLPLSDRLERADRPDTRDRDQGLYDLIYFDASDVSWEAEDNVIRRVAAPFGFDDLFAMLIRPNYALDNATAHTSKARRVRSIWPEVTVMPWDHS